MPTGGQAGRWQAITDTTTIESSLVDLKEKKATPQYRRFLYVDCIKRTTAALGLLLLLFVVVVSHIQRIGCQPEKTTLHGGQSRSWSAEQGKENKRKSLAAGVSG